VILFAPSDGRDLEADRVVIFDDLARGETVAHRIVGRNLDGFYVMKGELMRTMTFGIQPARNQASSRRATIEPLLTQTPAGDIAPEMRCTAST
jgi:hypothetical protein